MRLCNSRIMEEYLVCYQTSQRNWVIIKMLYRYLQRCLLGWHRSRLGFVTRVSERYLWALSVMHIMISLASNVTNELVAGCCITKWVMRLAGDEIELGMNIPMIESRASNIPMKKGITYVVITVRPIKIFVEYVGTNMSIQVPLLVIDQRGVSVMSNIVLELVGSARLTFDDDMHYMSYVFWWPKVIRSPEWDHGHDEESRNGREVNIHI